MMIWMLIGINSNNITSYITTLIVPLSSFYNKMSNVKHIKNKLISNGFSEIINKNNNDILATTANIVRKKSVDVSLPKTNSKQRNNSLSSCNEIFDVTIDVKE